MIYLFLIVYNFLPDVYDDYFNIILTSNLLLFKSLIKTLNII